MNWKNPSRTLSLAAAVIGALAFAGWVFGIEALKRIHPELVAIKANTALCLMLAGLAVALLQDENVSGFRRRVAQACAVIIAAVGLLTLGEYLGWWEPGIDQALFRESLAEAGRSFPGRMGPATAVNFMLLGLAVLLLDARPPLRLWASQFCALAVMAITFLIFLAYFYQVEVPQTLAPYISIALHTVIAFLLLATSILLARPARGIMPVLLAENTGGIIARRMVPAALLLPALLGWLCTAGRNAGYYGRGVGTALLATSLTLIFVSLVWWAARALAAAEARRRWVQEDLRRSERQLSDFFDNAAVSLHWVGPDGRVLRVNDTELALLGYAREEYVGRHIADFHADPPVIADILARLAAGETLTGCPARLRCKDGSLRDVLIDSSVYWEDGKFIHTRCFTRDVTELKRAQAARFQLAAIVDSSTDAIVSKTLDGIVMSWNAGAQRLFGYTSGEMSGQPITRIIPAERQSEEVEILRRLRAGEVIEHYETIRVGKDGRALHVSLSISPMRDETGAIVGASKIARDITQRIQAEAALAQQLEWFEVTLSSIGDAVIATDAQGVVTFLNPVAEAMTGWTSAEARGRPLPEVFFIINENTREPVENPVERVLRGGTIVGLANHSLLIARDGRETCIDDSAAPIRDAAGNLVGVVMVFHDVTERRRDAAALREARDAAEAANRAKDDFLAVLSHELRTPLTPALVTVCDLESALPSDPTTLREALALIRRNLELEARLVDDLLDVTRSRFGKLRIASAPVDLHATVRDAVTIAEPMLREKNIAVTIDLEATRHLVRGDAGRLAQVFSNLLTNAAKFTPSAGRVMIRSANDEGGELRIEVSDTGIGISPEVLPNIFEAFNQGDGTTSRFGGLGLGLSVARSLVEAHGGKIKARSGGRDQGATFIVTLTSLETANLDAKDPRNGATPSSPARSLRALVVEDHEDTRNVLHRLMTRWGHIVTVVGTVAQARDALSSGTFDLLISDIGLPDGSGLEVVATLREKSDVPAVAMSGYGMEADVERTREAGFTEHLVKPISVEALRELLTRLSAAPDLPASRD